MMSSSKASPSDASAVVRQPPITATAATPSVPLVIGVAGHRDLRGVDEREAARAVREVFRDLKARYPETPLVLLSPLNEGADRLAAKVAHDEGLPVIAVLPWPEGGCDEFLHRSGERSEFDRLLRQADSSVFLPLLPEASPRDLLEQPTTREQHYAQVGAYLARHSQILIALWDGNDCEDSATSNVVRWQREGAIAPFAPQIGLLDSVESGPVVHIVLPPKGGGGVKNAVERRMIYPAVFETDEQAEAYFHDLWSRIDEFNADVRMLSAAQPRCLVASQDSVLPPERCSQLDDRQARLLVHYAAADCAAAQFQGATRRTAQLMFVLVGLAVVAFEFYAHLLTDHLFLLATYLLLLVLCAGLVSRSRRSRLQDKYIDYRALAEALRVQFFWRLAGRTDSVADYYLRTFRSELDWICQAARACHLTCGGHSCPADPPAIEKERLSWILEHWVFGQAAYFGGAEGPRAHEHVGGTAHREEQRHRRFERAGAACFVTAIALAVVLFLVHWKTQHPSHLLVVVVFLTATAAALVHEYGELSGCAADATRYKWAAALFRVAGDRLKTLLKEDDRQSAQQLIGELGREALAENGDWVRQRRLKPLKTPAPA
ncbi:hypothetical protein AYO47_05285 [Planctomyces sp. SCGC AG-212-M04]|nr:hypothetical protein AYO47_05285 [Planctomyces sp. SCGC AG-212-M04]